MEYNGIIIWLIKFRIKINDGKNVYRRIKEIWINDDIIINDDGYVMVVIRNVILSIINGIRIYVLRSIWKCRRIIKIKLKCIIIC